MAEHRLGFDIGGTFTDLVLAITEGGQTTRQTYKILTDRGDLAGSLVAAASELAGRAGITLAQVDDVVHATTIATNAILERKGGRTAVITTDGFRDVLAFGRQKRYELYDLRQQKPAPLVARHLIAGIEERMSAEGDVVRDLHLVGVDRALEQFDAGQPAGGRLESVAVVLLHSYANDHHERLIHDRIRELRPELLVSLSSDVAPKRGEYERLSTTVADAYVKPVVDAYLRELDGLLREVGFTGNLYVMQSNGGLMSVDQARREPVRIIESGPAAGVLMAAQQLTGLGLRRALTLDMGGTTAKVGIVDRGTPWVRDNFEVDAVNARPGSGLPLEIPAIDLLEIGSGGGSIASVVAGTIRVGPQSAGSDPGPACYGAGGVAPTLTDANLVLGYLDPLNFAGGTIALDVAAAETAIRDGVAQPLGISLLEAAWGIHAVANASMERALRVMSVERGRDPRDGCLVAFGGAGPVHAARLAEAMSIERVLVPRLAGVGSAAGLLGAARRFDLSVTRPIVLDDDAGPVLLATLAALRARCVAQFELDAPSWEYRVDVRYRGQGHELSIELGDVAEPTVDLVRRLFESEYQKLYSYLQDGAATEIVNWTVTGVSGRHSAEVESAVMVEQLVASGQSRPSRAYFPEVGGLVDCAIWPSSAVGPGMTIDGPAIVAAPESTTVVPPLMSATCDDRGNLLVDTRPGGR